MSRCLSHCPPGHAHGSAVAVGLAVKLILTASVGTLLWLYVGPWLGLVAALFVLGTLGYAAREVVCRHLDDRREVAGREQMAAVLERERAEYLAVEHAAAPLALTAAPRQLEAAPIRVDAFRVDVPEREAVR